jgi:Na+/H+ antiporter NhaB
LIDKLPYLTIEDKNYFKKSADAVRYSMGISALMGPAQGGVATMVQEMAYLLIAKYAAIQNDINYFMGVYE